MVVRSHQWTALLSILDAAGEDVLSAKIRRSQADKDVLKIKTLTPEEKERLREYLKELELER